MYRLTLENEYGNQITFNELGGAYEIEKIEGLDPAPATINTSEVAVLDGKKFNSSKTQMRQLEMILKPVLFLLLRAESQFQ